MHAPREATEISDILKLLQPGELLGGSLFRSLIAQTETAFHVPLGLRLGPFAVRAEIGRGGMGVVYLAERVDGEFSQQVAIKCVAINHGTSARPDGAPDAAQQTLFRHERQLLAELKHPHIARFIDAGSTDSLLWFAMELVQGAHFDAHLAAVKPDLNARLALVQQVAGALSAAHARLLVHRDVKPSNVMIDADGSAKLLDFGIAGFASEALAAYSPGWASPEQLALTPTGPASDQYQLGRLLSIALQDLQLHGERGSELRAIAAKACAASPLARYGSVADFSLDIQRWQNKLPVLARGSGLAYSLRCAVRRHPWITAVAAAALIIAVGSLLWFNARLQSERDLARTEAARATATKDYLLSLFQDGDPTRGTDANLTARELIRAGVARVETDRSLPIEVRQELLLLMTEIQLRLGESGTAKRLLANLDRHTVTAEMAKMWAARIGVIEGKPEQTLAALQWLDAQQPSNLVTVMLARAELDAGKTQQSEQRIERLLAQPTLSATLRSSALVNMSVVQIKSGRPLLAIESNRQALAALALATPAVSPVPAYINTALAEIDLARFDSALANLAHAESLLVTFPHQRNQFLILQNRGMALFRKGDTPAANAVWQTLLGLAEHGVNPGIEAATLHNLAAIADANDDAILSIVYSRRAEILRLQLGDAVAAISSTINIAAKLSTIGLHARAIEVSEKAAALAKTLARPDLATRAELQASLSHCHLTPTSCNTRLQAVAEQFLSQNNIVKALESIEKMADVGYLVAHTDNAQISNVALDADALTRALGLSALLEKQLTDSPEASAELSDIKVWIGALQRADLAPVKTLAADNPIRQLVLVQMAIQQKQMKLAAHWLASFDVEREDYWRLKAQLAQNQQQPMLAKAVAQQRALLQARALAALADKR